MPRGNDISKLTKKINRDIGFYWWKRYLYCGFWSNISTPINLSITVLTALTTGQSATQSIVSDRTSTILGSIVLFVSIFNTFFKPNDQVASNVAILKKWQEHGAEFEEIVYLPEGTEHEQKAKLQRLTELFKKTNLLKRDTHLTQCIDMLVYCIQQCCLRNHLHWINLEEDNPTPNPNANLNNDDTELTQIVTMPIEAPPTHVSSEV